MPAPVREKGRDEKGDFGPKDGGGEKREGGSVTKKGRSIEGGREGHVASP